MKIATWNVNGIRARQAEVVAFVGSERPDILCLQELKATSDQVPEALTALPDYWSYWHGTKGYSGVSLHVRKDYASDKPKFWHPEFDHQTRIVVADVVPDVVPDLAAESGSLSVASIYVPNGGRDYAGKIGFVRALHNYAVSARAIGRSLLLCGDLNITRSALDVHPDERNPRLVGQRPEERALFEGLLQGAGLSDVGRDLDPGNADLFTWWAPWRNMRQRNVGWRLDYVLASPPLAARARRSKVFRQSGTSDHGAVLVEFDLQQA